MSAGDEDLFVSETNGFKRVSPVVHGVKAILAEYGTGGPAAYLGDDLTDEAAFRAMKGRGLSALVRREWRETEAEIWLRPPAELKGFLAGWARAVEEE